MHPVHIRFLFNGRQVEESLSNLPRMPRRGEFVTTSANDHLEILRARWLTPYTLSQPLVLEVICRSLT